MLYSSLLAGYLCASPLSRLALFPSCLCPSCRFPVTFSRLSGFNLFLPYLRSCRFLINHLICVYLLKVCLTIHLSCLLGVFSHCLYSLKLSSKTFSFTVFNLYKYHLTLSYICQMRITYKYTF